MIILTIYFEIIKIDIIFSILKIDKIFIIQINRIIQEISNETDFF